jgi:hypothetical protein
MPRFVVLEHDAPQALHWDFMLQTGPVLATWALNQPPDAEPPIAARPLPDHRAAYLDYEGHVSGHRGQVACWDRGTYEIERQTPSELVVVLSGRKLSGRARLCRSSEETDDWQFRFVAQ